MNSTIMNTKKKVYAFYITIIVLSVLAMMVFDLNLMEIGRASCRERV